MKKTLFVILMSAATTSMAADAPKLLSIPIAPIKIETPTTKAQSMTIGNTQAELDRLNAENALLTIQLKNIELKEKIKNGGQAAPVVPPMPNFAPPRSGGGMGGMNFDIMPDAKVVMVSGEPGRAVATINLNGAIIKAMVGRYIAGLGLVKSVSLDDVVIKTKKSEFSVPFVADSLSAPNGAMAGGMNPSMSLPPMPMGVR